MENNKLLTFDDIGRLYAKKTGDSIKHSTEVVKDVIGIIKETVLEGKSIQLYKFGTFEVRTYPEGTVRQDPYRKEKIDVSGRKLAKFRFFDDVKNNLN